MWKWIKLLVGGKAGLIKSMDELEKPFADLIRKAQRTSGAISADGFSKELVDEVQRKACVWLDVDPKEIGLEK